jgi:membrane protease YdiL (CAAX protease family)
MGEELDQFEEVSEPPPPEARPWGFWATLGWTGLLIIVMFAVQFVVLIAFVVVETIAGRQITAERLTSGLVVSTAELWSVPPLLALIALFVHLRRYPLREYLGLYWPTGRRLVALAMAGMIVFVVASDGLTYVLGKPVVPSFMVQVYRTAGWLPLLVAAVVVAAPIAEEVLFRGFLFKGVAESRAGPWAAIALSTVVWALLHAGQYDAYQVGIIVAGGLYLGYVRLRTGSVLLTIVLHAIQNLIATIEVAIKVEWLG